jgi:hypothetical protein
MDFSHPLSAFDIEADLAPLTGIQPSSASQRPQNDLSRYQFPADNEDYTPPHVNGHSGQKVFFITNCGSLLGRTIAQVALDQGHYVAACAREKHLADLNVRHSFRLTVGSRYRLSGDVCIDRM